eukprot:2748429-Prymnesium_polylepis.1
MLGPDPFGQVPPRNKWGPLRYKVTNRTREVRGKVLANILLAWEQAELQNAEGGGNTIARKGKPDG